PEWRTGQEFRLASSKPFDELAEAQALGINAKVVLVGPFSLALLGKAQGSVDVLTETLPALTEVYTEVIARLAAAGAGWIQLDEPCLVQGRTAEELAALRAVYERLATHKGATKLLVQTYFGHVGDSYEALCNLPVDGIGLDLVRGRSEHLARL